LKLKRDHKLAPINYAGLSLMRSNRSKVSRFENSTTLFHAWSRPGDVSITLLGGRVCQVLDPRSVPQPYQWVMQVGTMLTEASQKIKRR